MIMAAAQPTIEKYARHVNPAFVRLLGVLGYGRVFVRARDVWLWDDQGRRHLDFLADFGATNLGHNHPRLLERLREFFTAEAPNMVHTGPSPHAADLAEALAALLPDPLEVSLFSSSGAEAVEAGMKLARAASRREEFIFCEGGFHGTNLGSLSIMGDPRMRKPFEPLLSGCTRVPFGDLGALSQALSPRRAAAFVVEPIQGEGGIVLPPPEYLREAQDLCRRHGTLLILDEVQTGLGRTGRMFAFEAESVVPDVLVLAKSLGGGIAPISVTITSPEIHRKAYGSMDRFDLHSSTFSGNAFSCAASLETLNILSEENLVANSAARGQQLLQSLRSRLDDHPLVRDVRGRGLLVGIELGSAAKRILGQWAAVKLLEKGILCQPAAHAWNVLRLEPPLTVKAEHVQQVVDAVVEVLNQYRGTLTLLRDVTKRVGGQFLRRWKFR